MFLYPHSLFKCVSKMQLILLFCMIILRYFVCSESKCEISLTCGDCITNTLDYCVWCSAKEHEGKRCQSKTYIEENKEWCKVKIYDPQYEKTEPRNEEFSSGVNGTKTVQLRPQQLRIKVRPGVPVNFTMSYKPAKDYPLDIYYLIDSSYTMREHREKLKDQGLKIYEELTKLNNNVRLGMGSFIEKPAMPFTDTTQSSAYAFKNDLKLTQNMEKFTEVVGNIKNTGNYDDPEAGMDALMQVIACEEEVGWRKDARRIVVFSTDNTYHSAGDGKMVGAYKPNDMRCHLDKDVYNEALVYDYPSISQINEIAMDNNVKIIFTILDSALHHYRPLENRIRGAKVVALNSSDAVGMIIKEYNELVRNVFLESDLPSYVQIKSTPDCAEKDNKLCNLNQNALDMNMTLIIHNCPKTVDTNRVTIGINSLSEKLAIDVEVDCVCECEEKGQGVKDSPMCSEAGTYQCGVCKCNENRHGSTCRCTGSSTDTMSDVDKCTAKNETTPCSGRGTCRCGKCEECRKGFSGEFCQFDDNSCVRPGGRLCSGNGECKFGKCECYEGWTKVTECACPDHNRSCLAPQSKEVCSGNGFCDCGKCSCTRNDDYGNCTGRFCETCEKETSKICKELEDYALCIKNETKAHCNEIFNKPFIHVILENRTKIYSDADYLTAKTCKKVLEDGSTFVYRYDYTKEPPILVIQNELELPSRINIWIPIGSSIGTVLLIGLITVFVWKYLIDLHDAKEFQKFEEMATAWGYDVSQNPLYESPTVDVRNPAFNSDSEES